MRKHANRKALRMNSNTSEIIKRVNIGENSKEEQYKIPHLLDIQKSSYFAFVGSDGAKALCIDCDFGLFSGENSRTDGAYRRIIEEYFQEWRLKFSETGEAVPRLATAEEIGEFKKESSASDGEPARRSVWIELSDGLEAIENAKKKGTTYAAHILAWIAFEEKAGKPEDGGQGKELQIKQCEICQIPAMTPWGTFIVNGIERVVFARLTKLPGLYFVRDDKDGVSAIIFTEKGIRLTIVRERQWSGEGLDNVSYAVYQGKGKNRKFREELTVVLNTPENELDPDFRQKCCKTLEKEWFLIGAFGRESLVSKEIGKDKKNQKFLDPEDLQDIAKKLDSMAENAEVYPFDDLNQLTSKRAVLSGEFVGDLLICSLRKQRYKIQKSIREFMADDEKYCLSGRITQDIFRTFSRSTYVQYLDETNLLAEISQKRKIAIVSEKGYGGGKNIPEEMRHVQRSHYGRVCPVETPEGEKVGVVTTFAQMAVVDEKGIIRTPYLKPGEKDNLEYLSASEEKDEKILSFGAKDKKACECESPYQECRIKYQDDMWGLPHPVTVSLDEANGGIGGFYRDLIPGQMLSPASALIPFIEHDDGHRALMGAKMQCQAVPLLHPEAPFVGTGMEKRIVRESMVVPRAGHSGKISYVDGKKIRISYESPEGSSHFEEVELKSFESTRGKGCKHFRPIVEVGDPVSEGDVLADGYSSEKGELAIGANLLAAYMCWDGYNFEDGIVISDRLVKEDVLSSIHFHKVVIDVRGFVDVTEGSEKTLGYEDEGTEYETFVNVPGITDELKKSFQYSGENKGAVKVGTYVKPGDILVAKKRAVKAENLSRQTLLLSAVWRAVYDKDFFASEYEWVNTSGRVPEGIEGVVVHVRPTKNPSEGIRFSYTFTIAQKRCVQVGDKLAGRHGNKGVISKIVKASEMPYLPDGTPIDIILNPLGVPSRLNFGQLYECALGWAAKYGVQWNSNGWHSPDENAALPAYFACPSFDGPTLEKIKDALNVTNEHLDHLSGDNRVFTNHMDDEKGKLILRDGRTGKKFDNPVTVGYVYMMKLNHMVDDKVHARSAGSHYSIKEQPLKGRAAHGGQRLGEMEFWALESYGAYDLAREFLTAKSDHIRGRKSYY